MNAVKVARFAWPQDFPDVVIHAELTERDAHPAYQPAKSGDIEAAIQLVQTMLNEKAIEWLRRLGNDRSIFLAAVSAIETNGFNAIPDVLANEISLRLGWMVEPGEEIRQINKVTHTRAGGWHRLVTQAEFGGVVRPGAAYVLVDDHVGFGGTLANLRGYIESFGGRVIAMTTLTETRDARRIALREETLVSLRARYGSDFENDWKETVGYGFECFTEVEAGFLCRQRSVDYVRRQLAKAAKKASQRGLPGFDISGCAGG